MSVAPEVFQRTAEDYAAAWSSHNADAVAAFYAEDGQIVINGGSPISGRAAISKDCAQAFYDEFPDLVVHLDVARVAGHHALFLWTLEGTHAETGNAVRISGWEAWELNAKGQVRSSHGYFDATEYQRQIAEGV